MAKRLTVAQLMARYEALSEASEHLRMEWTDNPVEAQQGEIMADLLRDMSLKWLEKAELAQASCSE